MAREGTGEMEQRLARVSCISRYLGRGKGAGTVSIIVSEGMQPLRFQLPPGAHLYSPWRSRTDPHAFILLSLREPGPRIAEVTTHRVVYLWLGVSVWTSWGTMAGN